MKTPNLLLWALAIIMLTSCSKYEEGPSISLSSPERRVVGLYELEEIMIGEVNYISDYVMDSLYLRFSIGGEKDDLYIALVEDNKGSAQLSLSSFNFNKKKDKASFGLSSIGIYKTITDPIFELIPAIHVQNEWQIIKLSNNEFWIECDYEGLHYYLKFSKLEKYTLQ